MRQRPTLDQMMERMGFPSSEQGPYVTELRALVARQISEGMMNRSAGTWARDDLTCEERAKALLALEWELQHGHSCRVECLDPIVGWSWDIKGMKRSLRVSWAEILPWMGDRWREALMYVRIWRDRYILRRTNPYTHEISKLKRG